MAGSTSTAGTPSSMGPYGNAYVPAVPSSPLTAPAAPAPTAPATPPVSQPIVTAAPVQSQFANDSASLNSALNSLGINNSPAPTPTTGNSTPSDISGDPILSGLASLKTQNDAASNSLIASTQADYQNQVNKAQTQGDNYKAGLQLMGIQHNEATFSPDILSSHITEAANNTLSTINGLKAKEATALMTAQTARANNDYKSFSDAMTRYNQIQTEKRQAITDMNTAVNQGDKQLALNGETIYQTMQTLDPKNQEAFIQAVAKNYGVSVMNVMSSLTAAHMKVQKAENSTVKGGGTSGGYSYSGNDIATYNNFLTNGGPVPGTTGGESFKAAGSDGYVDPGAYLAVYNDWIANGGTAKGFVSKFPVDGVGGMVNPDSYSLLPKTLQPKVGNASQSSG